MRICYIGEIQSVINNLRELGAEISFQPSKDCDGIIVTDKIIAALNILINNYNVPIIVNGQKYQPYSSISVLVLDEDETWEALTVLKHIFLY